ncbi:MAG: hypothetical protein GVY23_09245 [Spirochaetes bacterium]|nr:hypothetical protein [Spirochaetota bacterium]
MAANGEPGSGRSNLVRVNIVLAVVDVLLLAAVIVLFIIPGGGLDLIFGESQEPGSAPAQEEGDPAADPEPEPEPAEEPAPEPEPTEPAGPAVVPGERTATARHIVETGDTFYEISGFYWNDEHLWPDLYMLNHERFPDPDLVRPGDIVEIYPSLASDGELSAQDIEVLSQAYVDTYSVYRRIGMAALERGRERGSRYWITRSRIKINKAHWLLYSGHRFNQNLAAEYAERIDERDLRVVRNYLERFGYPDP